MKASALTRKTSARRAPRGTSRKPHAYLWLLPLPQRALAAADPQPDPREIRRAAEGRHRLAVVLRVRQRRLDGWTLANAAKFEGISVPTAWRWRSQYDRTGAAGLLPKRGNSGCPGSVREKLITARMRAAVERLALLNGGKVCAAWQKFSRSWTCPEEIRFALDHTKSLPAALRRAVAIRRVSAVLFIGPKQMAIRFTL